MERFKNFMLITVFAYGIVAITLNLVELYGVKSTISNKQYIYISEKESLELSPENVLFWCNQLDIKFDSIVVAQSILETGWFTSNKCLIDNNIFGLQHSSELSFTYGHWLGSLIRYKKFQDTYYKGGDYYNFLDSVGYAEDSIYTEKLKIIVKQLNF